MSVAHLVSEVSINKAMLLGFADSEEDATAFLLGVANQSALATNPQGNRRYGVLFLRVDGGIVKDIQLDEKASGWCPMCFGTESVELPQGGTDACPQCQPTI